MTHETKKRDRLEWARDQERLITDREGIAKPVYAYPGRDVLINDWVQETVNKSVARNRDLSREKSREFADFESLRELILQEYRARIAGTRGGGEFETIDGLAKIQVTIVEQRHISAAIIAAEELVREILDDSMAGSQADMREMVDRAFVRNRETGKISAAKIVGLVNLNLSHPKWPLAQNALRDAIKSCGSKRYMRFYRRPTIHDAWELIEQNYSALPVEDGV